MVLFDSLALYFLISVFEKETGSLPRLFTLYIRLHTINLCNKTHYLADGLVTLSADVADLSFAEQLVSRFSLSVFAPHPDLPAYFPVNAVLG